MAQEFEAQLARKEDRSATFGATGIFWLLIILALILLALAVTILGPERPPDNSGGFASPTPTETRQPRIYTISYRSGVFSPTNLRIHAGDTVRFRNDSTIPLRIIGGDPAVPGFDSIGDVQPGSTFGFTFAAKGIFGYHNSRDMSERGTIMVR